ncbi:arylsulfatase B-like [Haemaphysalis longicornis]
MGLLPQWVLGKGWNDVSFQGSRQIPTPNLDAIAWDGIVLNSYYGQSVCSPSRAALLTGGYPIRLGLSEFVFLAAEKGGLPLNVSLMSDHLKKLGYVNHIVGKWHLGYSNWKYTPTMRGFDTHLGFFNAMVDYYTHIHISPMIPDKWGYDMWRNREALWNASGIYTTHLFTQRAVDLINEHESSKPLFLYLPYETAHSGNTVLPLAAPTENVKKFAHIQDPQRKVFAGMMDVLDQSVGAIVSALHSKSMLANSIIIFASDNGAVPSGFTANHGSNWPLRGAKFTAWEGGIRLPAFIWSPLLRNRRRVSWELMHAVDWLPTLYYRAGGNIRDLGTIDGVNQWDSLSLGNPSARQELLLNLEPSVQSPPKLALPDNAGLKNSIGTALRMGNYKYVVGTAWKGKYDDRIMAPGGEVPAGVNLDEMMTSSAVGQVLRDLYKTKKLPVKPSWRKDAAVDCGQDTSSNFESFRAHYLFDIVTDPCELRDISAMETKVVEQMKDRLRYYSSLSYPAKEDLLDVRGYPECNNCTWAPWMDKDHAR